MKKGSLFTFLSLLLAEAVMAADSKIGVVSQHPALSPSGQEIAFAADFDGVPRIWASSIDGSRLRKVSLYSGNDSRIAEAEPAWSPDGRQIVYSSIAGLASDIWVMQADGAHPIRLTANGASNAKPVWSPDGRRIAFVSDVEGTKDIWIMNSDGSGQQKLVQSPAQENSPSFSPNGDRLVFSRTENDTASLMVVSTNGGAPRALTTGTYHDWEPSWGARGILFSSNRDTTSSRWKIWVVQPDGSGLQRLGNFAGHDPVWMTDGQIAFTDESMSSNALTAVSVVNLASGTRRVIADVQGYLSPIDIRPGKARNGVNPRSNGRVQVAILSTKTLDARLVPLPSITFGRTGAEDSITSCSKSFKDVNGDGMPDLVCRFAARRAMFDQRSHVGVLRFADASGVPFEGRDEIVVVPTDEPEDFND